MRVAIDQPWRDKPSLQVVGLALVGEFRDRRSWTDVGDEALGQTNAIGGGFQQTKFSGGGRGARGDVAVDKEDVEHWIFSSFSGLFVSFG